jgi:hypothetical protein
VRSHPVDGDLVFHAVPDEDDVRHSGK